MKLIKNLFKSKEKSKRNVYEYLGTNGVSPAYMFLYKDTIDRLNRRVK